jgi:DNA-binding XRE family transcriptional regulator
MIKNERQFQITKKRLDDWEVAYHQLLEQRSGGQHAWVRREQLKGVRETMRQLKAQLKEYEQIRSGKKKLANLNFVEELPTLLIQWRIARKLTQRELADLLGVHEQQIQRYEESNYGAASLMTLQRVADILTHHKPKHHATS